MDTKQQNTDPLLSQQNHQSRIRRKMRLSFLFVLLTSTEAFISPSLTSRHAVLPIKSSVEGVGEKTGVVTTINRYDEEIQTSSSSSSSSGAQVAVATVEPPAPKDTGTSKDEDDFIRFSSPAEYEKSKFKCDDSVQFWRDFNGEGLYETQDFIREITDVSNRFVAKGGEALNYFLRHNARTGYFVTNAALGTLSSTLHERIRDRKVPEDSLTSTVTNSIVVSRLVAEALLAYEQDYECIAGGKYRLPYDMYTRNRQNSPLFVAQQTTRFISEAVGTLARRNRGSEEDKRIWLSDDKSTMYPDYYQNAFHYQTDGWMSQDSADVYETSTETLFLGTQDAMQRTALVPLVQYADEFHTKVKAAASSSGNGRPPMKVLEVACGTGRFLSFARDNLPLDTEFTAVDLSPFYLNNARDNDKNWRSIRKQMEAGSGIGNGNGNGVVEEKEIQIAPATFVQAKGEDLPFDDEEFYAVVCMYLYHEIPRDIRAQVSAEMARVTKKGGKVILTDSIQKGDRSPVYDKTIGNFEKMNEPHYKDYIEDFLPKHFEKAGLDCETKLLSRSTKTLAFHKPFDV